MFVFQVTCCLYLLSMIVIFLSVIGHKFETPAGCGGTHCFLRICLPLFAGKLHNGEQGQIVHAVFSSAKAQSSFLHADFLQQQKDSSLRLLERTTTDSTITNRVFVNIYVYVQRLEI